MNAKNTLILGIDPGIADTGFGIIKKGGGQLKLVDYGCIKTAADLPHEQRLKQINVELNKIIKKYKPDAAAIEKLFFCNNVKTALTVGEARGVIMLTFCQNNLPIYEFTPLQVKQAVSAYGKAGKMQVQKMVKLLLNMKEIPKPDDAADALAVAICCANSI
ncbi:MAG: crossover junction endodeoxyribonuclease RuvC [Patescibacteria group bacterium]|jgi:crossover junction endodeoxyribonuclease RuvC